MTIFITITLHGISIAHSGTSCQNMDQNHNELSNIFSLSGYGYFFFLM